MVLIDNTKYGDGMRVEIMLREKRKEKNMSLRELSRTCGVSISHLSDIETNKSSATIITLVKIAKALDTDIESLIKIFW